MALLIPCCSSAVIGQQFIPNPGFEQVLSCPDFQSQLDRTTYWTSPSTQGTPDYYHSCATNALYAVPQNTVGDQQPVDGDAYVGFFLMIDQLVMAEWREYIQTSLIAPLVAGRCYRFRLHAALTEFSLISTWSLGVRFNTGPYTLPDPFIPGDAAHITLAPGTFLDHENWTVLEGDYIASGGEDHLMIGNFLNDEDTPTQAISSAQLNAGPFVYVLVDGLSLSPCDAMTATTSQEQVEGVTLTADGLSLTGSRWRSARIRLFDVMGRTLLDQRLQQDQVIWPAELQGALIVDIQAADGGTFRRRIVR
jgi:hypothetical protein